MHKMILTQLVLEVILSRAEVTDHEEINDMVKLLDYDLCYGRVVVVHVEGVDDSPGDLTSLELDVLLGGHDGPPNDLGLSAVGAVPSWLAGAPLGELSTCKLAVHASLVYATTPT